MTDSSGLFNITRLASGGLITNYSCPSRCGHCLYRCGPHRESTYIARETLEKNIEKIRSMGVRSVHVGGGEPFLDVESLVMTLETAARLNTRIEYVETNSSWFKDHHTAVSILESLRSAGLDTLLISMSPFHNEFIPFRKVKGVLRACKAVGIRIFPWIGDFYNETDQFDDDRAHSMDEYERRYGPDYLCALPSRYWIHFGGRALDTFRRVYGGRDAERIVAEEGGPCLELLDVTHFHIDLYGAYIPGLCSGLAIERDDLGRPLDQAEYPFLSLLFRGGVGALLDRAADEFGYTAVRDFLNKCDLCYDIRRRLVAEIGVASKDLAPIGHYV